MVALARDLQSKHKLNPFGTFLTGFSNGADMSYMIACQASDEFTAVAPVAGALLESIYNTCSTARPIPVFIANGTDDPVITWTGDINNEQGWGAYFYIPFGFDFYYQINECSKTY